MKMYHATPLSNVESILRFGLLRSKARSSVFQAVWMVSASRRWWAIGHVISCKCGTAEPVAVIEIDVPKAWTRPSMRRGMRFSKTHDIPPERIVSAKRIIVTTKRVTK